MASLKFYHDLRATDGISEAPLKICLTHHARALYINIGVKLTPDEWDSVSRLVRNRPDASRLNQYISGRLVAYSNALLELRTHANVESMSVKELRDKLLDIVLPPEEMRVKFLEYYQEFAAAHEKESTRLNYRRTFRAMRAFDSHIPFADFEYITTQWLRGFERFILQTSNQNSVSIHLRNIRAVFNAAINEELTSHYPFRKFKIKQGPVVKRSFTTEQLRKYLFAEGLPPHEAKYRDYFALIFLLCGINTIDLFALREITSDGRIEYVREKTGKFYSIKVEPEAMAIIERQRGRTALINIADTYAKHSDHRKRLNLSIRRVCRSLGLPEATTYWARHTWATIAHEVNIPVDTIAQALGHGYGNSTTAIYINPSRDKVDEANRKVIDWVFYRKK